MISLKIDTKAMERELDAIMDGVKGELNSRLHAVGRKAVERAKESGTYHDVTGRLRSSNGYRVERGRDLVLFNSAPYAEEVEARGEIVLTTAALEAEQMLEGDGDDE